MKNLLAALAALVLIFLGHTWALSSARGGGMAFRIVSAAFKDQGVIAREYTCEGEDASPALEWEDPPSGAKSFALIMEDPDAPFGTFTHWIAYDIPGNVKNLRKGMPKTATLEGGIKQGTNDFGNTGYGGPCPPRGHGRHRYYFILKALDVPTLGLTPAKSKRELEKAMKGHVLGEARITGVFER